MAKQIVIFGTGPVGMTVMEQYAQQGGANVTLVNRSGLVKEPLPENVRIVKADVTNSADVEKLCRGSDVVYHSANPAYTEWPKMYPAITKGIIEGVSNTGAKLIVLENLYMYGPTGGKPLHEELPFLAKGPKGTVRGLMAKQFLAAYESGKLNVAIARASDFFGPRVFESTLGARFFGSALAGKRAHVLGNPNLPHTVTYIKDLARALLLLSESEEALGRAWHVPSPETTTVRDIADRTGNLIGKPVKLRIAGTAMVSMFGLFAPMFRELKETMYQHTEPFIVDHSAFERTFGLTATPMDTALRETVEWYRER